METRRAKTETTPLRADEQQIDSSVYVIQFKNKRDNRRGIDAATELGSVTQRKVGSQIVTFLSGKQLKELDRLGIRYQHYVPSRTDPCQDQSENPHTELAPAI